MQEVFLLNEYCLTLLSAHCIVALSHKKEVSSCAMPYTYRVTFQGFGSTM